MTTPTRFLSLLCFLSLSCPGFSRVPDGHFPCINDPDDCSTATNISTYFMAGTGMVQMTGTYDNTNATADPGDPAPTCFAEAASDQQVNNSLWFTFTADGGLFHLETVPCNAGGQYISGGDTQMAVFQGTDCNNLTPVACNEDLYNDNDPFTDFRAGLDLQTVAGQTYYLMIDGFAAGGEVATGLFCIEIIRMTSITCEQATAGTFQIDNNGFLCKGDNLLNALSFDESTFVIPNQQPLSGMSWALTAQPIPADTWPGSIPGIISTPLSVDVIPLYLQNNITSSTPQVFYLTPVVVGGATLINPDGPPKLPNLDISAGCFDVGSTHALTLVPVLDALHGAATSFPATAGQNNGAVAVTVNGGYPSTVSNPALYQFLWNTGATTSSLHNLGPGTYSVTISDPSGCTESIMLMADIIVPATEQSVGIDLSLTPNPAKNTIFLEVNLPVASSLDIEVGNVFGQTLQRLKTAKANRLEQTLDLSAYPDGLYYVRIRAGQKTAVRKIIVQR